MPSPLIAIAQLNPRVGDLAGNAALILAAAVQAQAMGAHLMLTGELALCGYPPEDLLLQPAFLDHCERTLAQLAFDLADQAPSIQVLLGHPSRDAPASTASRSTWPDYRQQAALFNAASLVGGGRVLQTWRKQRLPNYGVFDEERYFLAPPTDTPVLLDLDGLRLGVLICEDAWGPAPALACQRAGADALLVLNASPYHLGKAQERIAALQSLCAQTALPMAYAHLVGGQDELLFDGASFALSASGDLLAQAAAFAPDLILIDFWGNQAAKPAQAAPKQIANCITPHPEAHAPLEALWRALVLGVQDYVRKSGFRAVLLGLSGGIDSAVVAALALDALGAPAVRTVMLPSPYTAEISRHDAHELASRCGITHSEIPIAPSFEQAQQALAAPFAGLPSDVTEENLQARLRGLLLMALSNKTGALLLTCGNKSEYATGYCTLYGDMCGGFAPIKDVLKTQVFALARWRNTHNPFGSADAPIPERIITRPPSAELRPNQTDQDSLPPYEVLDAMLQRHLEQGDGLPDLKAAGFDAAAAQKLLRLIKISEYKRRQAAPGTRVSPRAFGRDWRLPIANHFLS